MTLDSKQDADKFLSSLLISGWRETRLHGTATKERKWKLVQSSRFVRQLEKGVTKPDSNNSSREVGICVHEDREDGGRQEEIV